MDGRQFDQADKDLLLDHDVEIMFCGTTPAGDV